NFLNISKYLGFSILIGSAVAYILLDPIDRLLSYQGPIISGGLLGWYVLMSNTPQDKFVEVDKEKVSIVSLLLRKRVPLFITIALALIIPWLLPQIYIISTKLEWLFACSFISEFVGGFLVGYSINSLTFTEKIILYSLGFAGDTLFLLILYVASNLFAIPPQNILNSIILLVYAIKFPEGAAFAIYIFKKVNVI
ncbi:hypothetical protein DJ521_06055, partial [Sulfolobus sp. E3]